MSIVLSHIKKPAEWKFRSLGPFSSSGPSLLNACKNDCKIYTFVNWIVYTKWSLLRSGEETKRWVNKICWWTHTMPLYCVIQKNFSFASHYERILLRTNFLLSKSFLCFSVKFKKVWRFVSTLTSSHDNWAAANCSVFRCCNCVRSCEKKRRNAYHHNRKKIVRKE
jgi:hypothetical protein